MVSRLGAGFANVKKQGSIGSLQRFPGPSCGSHLVAGGMHSRSSSPCDGTLDEVQGRQWSNSGRIHLPRSGDSTGGTCHTVCGPVRRLCVEFHETRLPSGNLTQKMRAKRWGRGEGKE